MSGYWTYELRMVWLSHVDGSLRLMWSAGAQEARISRGYSLAIRARVKGGGHG
jgi:hypothetical protein